MFIDEHDLSTPDRGWNYEPARAELLQKISAPLYTTDAEGWLTYYNDAAAELLGYRPELGKTRWCGSWRIFTTEGALLPLDQCPMAVAIKEGRAVRGLQAVLERPNGTRIPFMPYPTPLRDASGALVAASNVLVKLTDLRVPGAASPFAKEWPELTPAPLPADLGLDDLTGCLQATLAAQADVEFGYHIDCERLDDWSGDAAEKERILHQLEQRRQQQRAGLNLRLEQLQQFAKEIIARNQVDAEQRACTHWTPPTRLH
ncbi:PAS domain-containing protein [Methylorubrum extorquens]